MSQRTHEVGIRIALGAESRQVVRMVVGEGMRIVAVAVAIGLVGRSRRRGCCEANCSASDRPTLTFSAVTAVLGGVAMLACYLPARRASRVDPMVALRTD